MSLSSYDAPNGSYTSAIPAGTKAFREFIARKFGISRTEVVRDRSRCQSQRSEHCECGAVDFFPANQDQILGRSIFNWCAAHAEAAGIQSVIFARRVVGFGNPRERAYTGSHPHFDHVHVGLKRWARTALTRQRLEEMDGTPTGTPKEDWLMAVTEAEWNALKAKVDRVEKLIGDLHGSTFQEKGVIYRAIDKILKATFGPSEGADADGVVDAFARRLKGE